MKSNNFKAILFGIVTCSLSVPSCWALCVQADKAFLRYGPSTKHQKTWEVYKFMPFQSLKKQKDWYRVKDVDGDIHWIFKGLVTSSYKCAVVKAEKANLRTGPGLKYKQAPWGPAQKYYAFKVIGSKDPWYHVQDAAGGKAWVHSSLIWIQ
ncbi:MAG: hypothetical protein COV44_08835 [Deltaproteobacteria bacterium CG11_big_fil_rev_8_21_14_0_20_45_16]|nr:MAG: hypothetical protein COV44_08835 [Deltaproteobacteria bacterium CG11_big_fil_rev_8_21_14_0_20_45_16]